MEKYVCIKDVVMESGAVEFNKGAIYDVGRGLSIIDNSGDCHCMSGSFKAKHFLCIVDQQKPVKKKFELDIVCTNCGKVHKSGDNYCANCGNKRGFI